MYKVEYDEGAKVEFDQAFNWYANINPQLAIRFENEIDSVEQLISNHPRIARAVSNNNNIRQRPIGKTFPYNIIYQINEEQKTITILAIRHQKRRPLYS